VKKIRLLNSCHLLGYKKGDTFTIEKETNIEYVILRNGKFIFIPKVDAIEIKKDNK